MTDTMRALNSDELRAWVPPYLPCIISDNILVRGTKMLLFGKAGSWKSNLTIQMGYSIANGLNWFGYPTFKNIVYILQAEIPQIMVKERIEKFTANNYDSPNLHICTASYSKLDKGFGIASLRKDLERTHAKLLIVDPLYKFISGKLTDERDMMEFFDRIDILAGELGLTTIIVHHPRKGITSDGGIVDMGSDEMYGTYVQNWADTIIRTDYDEQGSILTLIFSKVRHAQKDILPISIKINKDKLTYTKVNPLT